MNTDYKSVWNSLADTEDRAKIHVGGTTDETKFATSAAHTIQVLEATVGVHPSDTCVEIGCGVGRVGAVLAPRVTRWVGCDVSGLMIEHARRRLAALGNIALVETSGVDLQPLPDASADLVYCTVVFMHLEPWERFAYAAEARRILRPGGRFYCDNINLESEEGWQIFEQVRAMPAHERPQFVSRCSTHDEMRIYLTRAGFLSVRTESRHLWVQAWGRT
jgi:ubiquinone/menaquinone biosynthesis C-methylase UbiE